MCLNDNGSFRKARPGAAKSAVSCQVLEGSVCINGAGVNVYIANASSEPLVIPPLTQVASLFPVTPEEQIFLERDHDGFNVFVHQVVAESGPNASLVNFPDKSDQPFSDEPGVETLPSETGEIFTFPDGSTLVLPIGISLKHLDLSEAAAAAKLVHKYHDVFSGGGYDLGFCDAIPHQIRLTDNTPVNLPYRRITPNQIGEVKELLQDLLNRGVIRRSCSPYASPVVLVRKKTGKLRLCIDYRCLNVKTAKD